MGSSDHIVFVKSLPCVVCGTQPVDAHHIIGHGRLSLGLRVDDLFTLPLCRPHHDELHRKGWKEWEDNYGSQHFHCMRTLAKRISSGT